MSNMCSTILCLKIWKSGAGGIQIKLNHFIVNMFYLNINIQFYDLNGKIILYSNKPYNNIMIYLQI